MTEKSKNTKLLMAESFARLASVTPLDRITVDMVVEALGKHRKTFYYHFANREQLIVWLFRRDLAEALESAFPAAQLVFEPSDDDHPFADFPFYIRNVQDDGRIYNAPFFSTMADTLEARRDYYRRILALRGPGTLDYYLHDLYRPALRDDMVTLLESALEGRPQHVRDAVRSQLAGNAAVDFLSEYYTGAFITRFTERLNYQPARRHSADIRPFENVTHDSLALLMTHTVQRIEEGLRS